MLEKKLSANMARIGKKRRKQISQFDKGKIKAFREMGMSIREIKKKVNRSTGAIHKVLTQLEERGHPGRKRGTGLKNRKTTARDDRKLLMKAKANRRMTASQIAAEAGVDVSRWTVSRRLKEAGLLNCVACKKPLVSEKNRKWRLQWCKNHENWTAAQWRRILWTDESPFTLRWNGQQRVWRSPTERYCPDCMVATLKQDKRINVSGSFAATGVGDLFRVKGIMRKENYREILKHHLVPSGVRLLGRGYIFQQDNDPKHTAKIIKLYFVGKTTDGTLILLEWPSQSPDLNPIENLWQQLNSYAKDRSCNNEEELFDVLKAAWENIPLQRLTDLIDSMPRRVAACIANKGLPTKY